MATVIESIKNRVLQLSIAQRLELVDEILASVEVAPLDTVSAAWDSEIRARLRRYDEGKSKALSGPKVFKELARRLKS